MNGHFTSRFRRFVRNSDGATIIEFALIFPIVLMLTFGIMEISLCMASLVTLEGGLKEASRYGITSQTPGTLSAAELALVPTAFKVGDDPRMEQIGLILNQNTLDLIDLDEATITTSVYTSFSVIEDGEPYTDLPDIPNAGDPPNGQYDGPGTAGAPAAGEPFSDMNCNGVRDGPGASDTGVGDAGDIVVYTVTYYWNIMTPIIGQWLGEPDPDNAGRYRIPMSASVVVKNEPNLSGSSYCS